MSNQNNNLKDRLILTEDNKSLNQMPKSQKADSSGMMPLRNIHSVPSLKEDQISIS